MSNFVKGMKSPLIISQKLQNALQSVYQLFQMNKSSEVKSVDEMNKSLAMN